VTFPFHLEAHVRGTQVEVHGAVSGQRTREQALNIAQLHTPFAIIDRTVENAKVGARAIPMPPGQLQSTIQNALRESFPRQAKLLQTRCTSQGGVVITGSVVSMEQKVSISKALQRLYGPTSVTNLARVDGATDVLPAPPLSPT